MKKAILFDLDDTLIVDEVVSRETFEATAQAALKKHGAEPVKFARDAASHARRLWKESPVQPYCKAIGISAFECLWGNFAGESADLTALREWSLPYRESVFDAALREQMLDHADGGEELSKVFSETRRKLQRLVPDAREVLTRLSADYKIGLLTNGAPDLQREKLAASGLESFFQAVAVSGEHGIGKPRPEIFQRLLAELGVSAEEAVMVGNSKERDIMGARNAGIYSVWIRVAGSEEPDDVEPDATIIGLAELPKLLQEHVPA